MTLRAFLPLLGTAGLALFVFLPADVFAASLPGLDDTCLESPLQGCTVLTSGYVALEQGPRIAFQTQSGFTDADGIKGGITLFEEGAAGWTLFASAFDGYRYDVPRVIEHDQTLLHVAGYSGGTGAYNTDLLFAWGDTGAARLVNGWRPVDMENWLLTINTMLPAGLEIWKGVDYDFDDWFYGELNARTPLWREDDGNCCPSGGWATIHLAIENNALVAKRVDYLPPPKAK